MVAMVISKGASMDCWNLRCNFVSYASKRYGKRFVCPIRSSMGSGVLLLLFVGVSVSIEIELGRFGRHQFKFGFPQSETKISNQNILIVRRKQIRLTVALNFFNF